MKGSDWAVIATGPSLTAEQVKAVRKRCRLVVVSDAWQFAPDADAMVSADAKWWDAHPEVQFAGRRFTAAPEWNGHPELERIPGWPHGRNSGLLGIRVAVELGATRVLLLGFDMQGAHFFGRHPEPLKNTTPERFRVFMRQFSEYRPRGVKIINCTPGSALNAYPQRTLEDCLAEPALLAW